MKQRYLILNIILVFIIISVTYYSIRVVPLRAIYYSEQIIDISSVAYDLCYNVLEPSMNNYYVAKPFTDLDAINGPDNEWQYDYKELDVEYHEDPKVIAESQGMPFGSMVVIDKNGNQTVLINPNIKGSPVYYDPTTIKYSMSSYVPSYTDSIYLRSPPRPPVPTVYAVAAAAPPQQNT